MQTKNIIGLTGAGTVFALCAILGVAGLTTIEPGEVGVLVKNLGDNRGMQDETLGTGMHWVNPFVYDVVVYDTRLRQYTLAGQLAVPANTRDGQPVTVDISFEMGLVDSGVPRLHEDIGPNYWDQVVLPLARSTVRNETAAVLSDAVYTGEGRDIIQQAISAGLASRLEPMGIRIEPNLRDITFLNKDFIAILEQKASAAQKEEIQRREALAAAQEAIRVRNQAEGQRLKVEQEAQAERERLRLLGEGQRLQEEERAMGILAVAQAEAEGLRLKQAALAGEGAEYLVSMEWAKYLGPNVKVYGVPTGAENTSTFLFDDALRGFAGASAAAAAAAR